MNQMKYSDELSKLIIKLCGPIIDDGDYCGDESITNILPYSEPENVADNGIILDRNNSMKFKII